MRRQIPEIQDDAASHVGADDGAGISKRGAVEFTVADGHHFADGVHDGFTILEREPGEFWGRPRDFFSERDLAACDQGLSVIVETARAAPIARAGEAQVVEIPADGKVQRVIKFGALAVGDEQLLEAAH